MSRSVLVRTLNLLPGGGSPYKIMRYTRMCHFRGWVLENFEGWGLKSRNGTPAYKNRGRAPPGSTGYSNSSLTILVLFRSVKERGFHLDRCLFYTHNPTSSGWLQSLLLLSRFRTKKSATKSSAHKNPGTK